MNFDDKRAINSVDLVLFLNVNTELQILWPLAVYVDIVKCYVKTDEEKTNKRYYGVAGTPNCHAGDGMKLYE
ncbi:hypothetical protein RRG08_042538 [Elysia crispata]|uniref:Uncharacterized protein n=1 Tax=Elysia crispata TaxID=231223 RepID=A0AAE1CKK5_9GAST|nr:hypothetical protein RRG08_042538 [Elysia crispata]